MRKLAVAAAVSLALASGGANALILGEIDMRSALNQPMNAEIRLSSIETGELDGMIVRLASPEAFARAGIERTAALNDLAFAVINDGNGEPRIRITSKRPVLEPFLNFLLEVDWTRGRMVREYTVLLDPPVFMTPSASSRNSVADSPAVVDATDGSILQPVPIERDAPAPFDESAVVVVGDIAEVADSQIAASTQSGVEVDLGEVVELGELVEIGDQVGVAADSTVVSLDGLGATNEQAVVLTDPNAVSASLGDSTYNPETGWEVALLGDAVEVEDNVGVQLLASVPNAETVSLDELTPAQPFTSANSASAVTVNRNDTLWGIATANKQQGLSTQQMMLALLEANQQAFINGNINLVKAGAILRIPEAAEISVLSQGEAIAQVGAQEQLWREYRDNLRGSSSSSTALASADSATDASAGSAADISTESTGSDSTSTDNAATDSTVADNTSSDDVAASGISNGGASLTANSEDAANTVAALADVQAGATSAQSRDELRIVATQQPSTTVASTTADETESPDAVRLGDINLKLKLAREELAAARLEAGELTEQNSELESMTENMDQLVTMRQDQLAKLQAQLEAARTTEADEPVDVASLTSPDSNDAATETTTSALDNTAPAAGDVIDSASTTIADAAENVSNQVSAAAQQAGDTATDVADTVASVDATTVAVAGTTAAVAQPWYKSWMADPKVLGLGVGGLALGGLLFALLRRRKHDEGDEDLDEVVFVDGDDTRFADDESTLSATEMSGRAEAHVAAAAVETAEDKISDPVFDEDETASLDEFAAELDGTADETTSKDDTVSEAEVYLAYGLHGQAEDLLKKAIEKNPENTLYQLKLLQTYHTQNKVNEFDETAELYHEKLAAGPDWQTVQEMGQELNPSNALYHATGAMVESVGRGDLNAPKLDVDDFDGDAGGKSGVSSQIREFSSSDTEAVDFTEAESALDQTMDPALAFSEADLEATGDFTQLSNELNDEVVDTAADAGLDFPADFATDTLGNEKTIAVDTDVLTSAEDLTRDLDKLEGELDLDSTEMLEGGLDMTQDLEIPDLTSGSDLTADASAAFGNVDEMDTRMDLAKAYIDMGDNDSASSALGEIIKSGNPEQKNEAEILLRKIS